MGHSKQYTVKFLTCDVQHAQSTECLPFAGNELGDGGGGAENHENGRNVKVSLSHKNQNVESFTCFN